MYENCGFLNHELRVTSYELRVPVFREPQDHGKNNSQTCVEPVEIIRFQGRWKECDIGFTI